MELSSQSSTWDLALKLLWKQEKPTTKPCGNPRCGNIIDLASSQHNKLFCSDLCQSRVRNMRLKAERAYQGVKQRMRAPMK